MRTEEMAALILKASSIPSEGFPIQIGGSQTMDELVAAGNYDGVHSLINQENFPVKRQSPFEVWIELVGLDRIATSEDAVVEFKKRGLRRPNPEEAVRFGEQYPDAQRHRPIVWPHQPFNHPFDGSRRVFVHFGGTGYRSLDLYIDSAWGAYCVFAGVREEVSRQE